MSKKVLIVDDSALMRRVFRDIISKDERFHVADEAVNGMEALELLRKNSYDAVVLDVNMPKMNGLELLRVLHQEKEFPKVMMASLYTKEGAKITMDALDYGALDFIHIPTETYTVCTDEFAEEFISTLLAVANSTPRDISTIGRRNSDVVKNKDQAALQGNKIVAIASSTGGPQALKALLPLLPANLSAPVVIVQHMPPGFTRTLAERLDTESNLHVKEAEQGEILYDGVAYLAPGGKHMRVKLRGDGKYTIVLSEESPRENVRPCANYLFESLRNQKFDEVECVVLTGMGSDGTEGIDNLLKEQKIKVMVQSPDTCVVFGMPGSILKAQIDCKVMDIETIAKEIIKNVGVE